jgi:hypothetical protein
MCKPKASFDNKGVKNCANKIVIDVAVGVLFTSRDFKILKDRMIGEYV